MGMKDAAGQLDQFAVVAEQQQIANTGLRRGHQHGPHPVPHLQHGPQTLLAGQIQAILTDHQNEASLKRRIRSEGPEVCQHLLQLIRCGAALHLRLGADQRQTINNTEGSIAGAFGQDAAPRKNRLHQQAPTRRHQGQQIPLQQLTGKTGETDVPLSTKTTHPFSGLQLEHRLGCSDPGHPHPDLKIPRQIKARPWITTANAQGLSWGQRSR